jgi:hypothetical protein
MTDLLDSVYNQYPIGSLLIWETDLRIATLDHLGPFTFPPTAGKSVGYILDGHQRLATLAAALVAREANGRDDDDLGSDLWDMSWNMESKRFQHGLAEEDLKELFPLTSLLDTLRFFESVRQLRGALSTHENLIDSYTDEVSRLARAFQSYRVPVIRIRRTGLSEAVEIFSRLNSKGQTMTADQMVSALMYRQGQKQDNFDLAAEIDSLEDDLAEQSFGDIDRTTILRGILANLDEDIYRTDWTRLTSERRERLLPRLKEGVERTSISFDRAVEFLADMGVRTSRLLPYAMQLVLLSAFFDKDPAPAESKLRFLRLWFWTSSFSGWFGGANTARVSNLVKEFRKVALANNSPTALSNFDMRAEPLPFPASYDMRNARTRTLLLVMLSLEPRYPDGTPIEGAWREIAEKGPGAVGHIFGEPPPSLARNPANRMIRPPGAAKGLLNSWIDRNLGDADDEILASHALDRSTMTALHKGDVGGFIRMRQQLLVDAENSFQRSVGLTTSRRHGRAAQHR